MSLPKNPDRSHGTAYEYKCGCRCDLCKQSNTVRARAARKKSSDQVQKSGLPQGVKHGVSAYRNWGCRCRACTEAASSAAVEYNLAHYGETLHRSDCEYGQKYQRDQQESTRETATKHYYEWTGAELEVASNFDYPSREVALMLGRTLNAVQNIRRKLRTGDPKKIRLLGVAFEHHNRSEIHG